MGKGCCGIFSQHQINQIARVCFEIDKMYVCMPEYDVCVCVCVCVS